MPHDSANRQRPRVPTLAPIEEFGVAMQVITQFGQAIQNADTKSGMLGALLGLLLAAIAGQPESIRATLHGTSPIRFVLLLSFATSLLVAGVFLGLTQIPRLVGTRANSWVAFPTVSPAADGPLGRPSVVDLRDEAWHQVQILATIARVKFQCLRVAMAACGVCALTCMAWLTLVT